MFQPLTCRLRQFWLSRHGNVAVTFTILLLPLMLAVGMATDYGMATNNRSAMQNALDAAAFAALSLPKTASLSEREKALDDNYLGNGGFGTAQIVGDITVADGRASLTTEANYNMPTNFMQIAGHETVPIATSAVVSKPQVLTKAKFKLKEARGWWNKTVTLFGRSGPTAPYKPLVTMVYVYNGLGGIGAGTTTLNKYENGVATAVYRTQCLTAVLTNCTSTKLRHDGTAEVDVSGLNDIYLQMDISTTAVNNVIPPTVPRQIRSNDANLADRLFVKQGEQPPVQQPKGTSVDIQKAIGCDEWTEQRWEDGGGFLTGQTPWDGTDFRYEVSGICDWGSSKTVMLTR